MDPIRSKLGAAVFSTRIGSCVAILIAAHSDATESVLERNNRQETKSNSLENIH
jgi:hypothetical protein